MRNRPALFICFHRLHACSNEDQNLQMKESSRLKEKAMDVFKLAFETVIIGLFALPWLWVMIDLMSPDLFRSSPKRTIACVMAFVPLDLWPPVMSLVMFCLAYLLGSAISPIATEFLNDRGLVGRVLYTSEKIQIKEYVHMETKTD